MSITFKDKTPISNRAICGGVLALAASWLILAKLLAEMAIPELLKTVVHCASMIFETLLIGGGVAFIADRYLKRVFDESDAEQLARMGIGVHSSRQEASAEMLKCVDDAHNIDIIGISLRDFLLSSGKHRDVWDAIVRRLAREQEQQIPEEKRLRIRLLLLDPRSGEGLFRHELERTSIGRTGIPYDVPQGLEEVQVAQIKVYNQKEQNYLMVRLYHHCPFAFQFLTNDVALVEQYYYKEHTHKIHIPLLRYTRGDRQNEFRKSFEKIWHAARIEALDDSYVGTDYAIDDALIKNIYRGKQRDKLSIREQQIVDNVGEGSAISILAITGKFYTSRPFLNKLRDASTRGVSIRIALLNPVCCQSILRAVADSCSPSDIDRLLTTWDWQKHKTSDLYLDIKRATRDLLKKAETSFDIRLHHSAIACALFLAPGYSFVEQYLYGRSRTFEKGQVLGGEYPVFEFGTDPGKPGETDEQQMLSASFDVVWNSFSIPLAKYLEHEDEEEANFQKSLEDVRRWLALRCEKSVPSQVL